MNPVNESRESRERARPKNLVGLRDCRLGDGGGLQARDIGVRAGRGSVAKEDCAIDAFG